MKHAIAGDDFQTVEFSLDPNEFVVSEPGAMIYKTAGVALSSSFGGRQNKGLVGSVLGAGKRMLTGESWFVSYWKNETNQKQTVAFASSIPGKIVPIDLSRTDIVCRKDSFLCAASDVAVSVFFQKKVMTALFGGAGFMMQKLSGSGTAFIAAGGSYREFELRPGERFQCDAGCLLAFESGVDFRLESAGSLKGALFGGEGLFFADFVGPGRVWVQSMPVVRLAAKMGTLLRTRR